jgi:hypothetical protein
MAAITKLFDPPVIEMLEKNKREQSCLKEHETTSSSTKAMKKT